MQASYLTQAIIINRRPLAEDETKVIVYSLDKGKLELVARGTKKIKSKLAGHLEPIGLVDLMIIPGRQTDYIASATVQLSFTKIKSDLAKLVVVGQLFKIFDQLIKPAQADKKIFKLLLEFLILLEADKISQADYQLFNHFFIWQLVAILGHSPQLYYCQVCQNKILPGSNKFNLAKGGLVCAKCAGQVISQQLTISDNGIKLLRLAGQKNLDQLIKITINNRLKQETIKIISSFLNYYFPMPNQKGGY